MRNFLRRVMVTGVVVGTITSPLTVSASAGPVHPSNDYYYVSPNGTDSNNKCTSPTSPCLTIAHAIEEEGSLTPDSVGGVINLSRGTFNAASDVMFAALSKKNSNVTIKGVSATKTVVVPTSCDSVTTMNLTPSMIALGTGENGISIDDLDLRSAWIVSNCSTYDVVGSAGVYITGGTTGDAIEGDHIDSGATYGILTDDGANSMVVSDSLASGVCKASVKSSDPFLDTRRSSPVDLEVSEIPRCAKVAEFEHGASTVVSTNGTSYCAQPSPKYHHHTIVLSGIGARCAPLTGDSGAAIRAGATVVFGTSTAPFTQWGIACNSPVGLPDTGTACVISDNTVSASGFVLTDLPSGGCSTLKTGVPPMGIVVTGGAAGTITGNSVSDVTDSLVDCPEAGATLHDGIGIALLPDTAGESAGTSVVGVNTSGTSPAGAGNVLSGDDYGVDVIGGSNPASYQANSNSVSSGTEAGMLFSSIGSPDPASFRPGSPPSSNFVTEEPNGVGYTLDAVHDQTFGGNSASGDEIGLMLSGASDGDTIRNNSLTGDRLYGLLVVGQYQPEEVQSPAQYACSVICPTFSGDLSQSTGASSASNTFNDNAWTGNGTGAPLLNGANVLDGTGWGGGCASEVASCAVGTFTFDGSDTTFDSTSPGTSTISIAVCNASMESAVLPPGSEVTFYSTNQGESGTFYVTTEADVPGRNCTSGSKTPYSLSVQALDPQLVGTDSTPSGQPYVLDTGSTVTVNVNGATTPGLDFYGTAANSNSCTPLYGYFGTSKGPPTLDSGSGGVNATYLAC